MRVYVVMLLMLLCFFVWKAIHPVIRMVWFFEMSTGVLLLLKRRSVYIEYF